MPDKPAGMSWEDFSDSRTRIAMRNGEFTDLPGAGKPIPGLDEPYRDDWWLRAFLQREQVSVPCPALNLRAEVEAGLEKILALPTETAVRRHTAVLNEKIALSNRTVISGPSTSVAVLDIERVVARWKDARRARARTP